MCVSNVGPRDSPFLYRSLHLILRLTSAPAVYRTLGSRRNPSFQKAAETDHATARQPLQRLQWHIPSTILDRQLPCRHVSFLLFGGTKTTVAPNPTKHNPYGKTKYRTGNCRAVPCRVSTASKRTLQ